jgi:hypothetical protein
MSALVINGVTYNGAGGNPHPPSKAPFTLKRIGRTLVAANGARTFVDRGTDKRVWVLSWENADPADRTAVRALALLSTTFTFTDEEGVSYTVQVEEDDAYTHEPSFTKSDNGLLYDLSITLRQV